MDLRITLSVNGQVMQDESTKDMIFDVPRLVSYASRTVRLEPGDLILTGSPAGNGARWGRFLRDGDRIDAAITGLRTRTLRARLSSRLLEPGDLILTGSPAWQRRPLGAVPARWGPHRRGDHRARPAAQPLC